MFITLFTIISVESRNLQKPDRVDSSAHKSHNIPITSTVQLSAPIIPQTFNRQQHNQPSVIQNRHQHQQQHHHQNNQYHSSQHHHHNQQQLHRYQPTQIQNFDMKIPPTSAFIKNNQQSSVCQLANSKCQQNEASFNRSALVEFQKKLDYTSADLRQLIKTYWEEFKALSLDLILVAKNNTLSKTSDQYFLANERLFNAMHAYLNNYETAQLQDYDAFPAIVSPSNIQAPTIPNMDFEITNYFHRLYSIQLKRLLDSRLVDYGEVDLECLSSNLRNQQELEKAISELTGDIDGQEDDTQSYVKISKQQLLQEQTRITQSIKQSLEFTKTLLSSLSLSNGMFYNLTHGPSEWMPHSSCHQALARMTLCPHCYVPPARKGASTLSGSTTVGVDVSSAPPPPCENYCLNVVRGCMNDIYELHRDWVHHVNALARFKTNMIQMNNIENVMSNLDEKLINFMTKLTQRYNTSSTTTTTSSSFSATSTVGNSEQSTTGSKVSNSIFFLLSN